MLNIEQCVFISVLDTRPCIRILRQNAQHHISCCESHHIVLITNKIVISLWSYALDYAISPECDMTHFINSAAPPLLLRQDLLIPSVCISEKVTFDICRLWPPPYPEPVVFQWQSSGNPVCLELRPQCTLECHWRHASVLPVVFQWCSSGFPVVFQCVPIMQINTGSPLGHHRVLASASVVPVASQCTCGSSGLPVCSNYAN